MNPSPGKTERVTPRRNSPASLVLLVLAAVLIGGARVAHFVTPHANPHTQHNLAAADNHGLDGVSDCSAPDPAPAEPTHHHNPDWDCLFCQNLAGPTGAGVFIAPMIALLTDPDPIGLIRHEPLGLCITRDIRSLGPRAPPIVIL